MLLMLLPVLMPSILRYAPAMLPLRCWPAKRVTSPLLRRRRYADAAI